LCCFCHFERYGLSLLAIGLLAASDTPFLSLKCIAKVQRKNEADKKTEQKQPFLRGVFRLKNEKK